MKTLCCECKDCIEAEYSMWREFGSRVLKSLNYAEKQRWFKSEWGSHYLSTTNSLKRKIKQLGNLCKKTT
jgi:hypothetical protein